MKTTIEQVEEFHNLFNHPILPAPAIPDVERVTLRINLLKEELKELEEAANKGDIVEVADALCDLQYVLDGAKLEFGFKNIFGNLFNEVHRSNLSKACKNIQEALETKKHFDNKGEYAEIVEKENGFIVLRASDKKLLKSINYSPANIERVINKPLGNPSEEEAITLLKETAQYIKSNFKSSLTILISEFGDNNTRVAACASGGNLMHLTQALTEAINDNKNVNTIVHLALALS